MACCVFVLGLVYQVIDAWQRVKLALGLAPVAAESMSRPTWRERLRGPRLASLLLALLAIESALAGHLLYTHRIHIRDAVVGFAFASTAYAVDLCRSSVAASDVVLTATGR